MMFKNKRVLLSSVAIVLTLIVSAIFVNFTLAKSGSVADDTVSTSASTGLTGYSNIDLAVINSNDTSLQSTGDDKYRIVQILPASLSSYAAADTALTAKVTAAGYNGTISSESDYANTSDLWKYVYDGEYFRYAVFDGYKTISDMSMAEGAVQLTSVAVNDLNDMDAADQEILASADMIYICAMSYTDYITTDISEDLYNWLDSYATVDRHPVVIDYDALCVQDAAGIIGNNDSYRMGALAYKLMTKTHASRYDNVLVTGPVQGEDGKTYTYFYSLYLEASNNKQTTGMTSTTKTISDFILRAEELGFVENSPYYNKWYVDDSFETFAGAKSAHGDSAYAKVVAGDTSGLTGEKTSWDFDNANILVISNGESTKMYGELTAGSDASGHPAAEDYVYDTKTGVWKSVETAPNSKVTSSLYYTANDKYKYAPSGADIYRVESENLMDVFTSGGLFEYRPSQTAYMDVATSTVQAKITVKDPSIMEGANVILFVKNEEGIYVPLSTDEDGMSLCFESLTSGNFVENTYQDDDGNDVSDGTYSYTVSFDKLNADYEYKLFILSSVNLIDADNNIVFNYDLGYNKLENGYITTYEYYIAAKDSSTGDDAGTGEGGDDAGTGEGGDDAGTEEGGEGEVSLPEGYDYDSEDGREFICSYALSKNICDVDDYQYAGDGAYLFPDAESVMEYVDELHKAYTGDILAKVTSGTGKFGFSDFDFIFIEKGAYADEIGYEIYNQLIDAVGQGTYVIVSSEAGDGVGSGSGGESSGGEQTIIVSPSAKAIADIINSGVYRDGADNKFRVLEIQPDYPIDTDVAESQTTVEGGWKYHSDGTAVTGDYYTVPSDVVAGKAQEELPPSASVDVTSSAGMLKEEYYQFDLTKAKIAYAIDGLSYEQIEITQVSTEALIGMTEDIAATYDLIYIGGDISAMDRDVDPAFNSFASLQGIGGHFKSMMPVFIMYTHTGSIANLYPVKPDRAKVGGEQMLATPYIGTTSYSDVSYTVQNGNDLTNTKYEELINYISSGRPVIVSDELTSVYENMNYGELSDMQLLMGYWYKDGVLQRGNVYLDPTSRMYALVDSIYTRSQGASGSNILWGFDPDSTQKIDNQDETYGKTLYTLRYADSSNGGMAYLTSYAETQGWYNNESNVIKSYATVFTDEVSAEISNLVNQSSSRVRLTVTSKPTAYKEGIESTYISYTNLSYSFIVNGKPGTYTYTLYVDKDKNTSFYDETDYSTSGTVKVASADDDTETTVNLALDSDFFGSVYWLLEIKDTGDNVVAQETGISKIVNTVDDKSEINVLQVQTMVDGQTATTWNVMDSLYFDIMSQDAHKICLYNTYANQTDLDNVSAAQYACLGRHENRFGIIEYDTSISKDDHLSNLADALTDDYNINLDIIVSSKEYANFTTGDGKSASYGCLDKWVEEAETLAGGGTVDGINQAGYKALVANALSDYNAKTAITETKKAALDNFLSLAIDYLDGKDTGTRYYNAFHNNTQHNGFFVGFNGSMSNADIKELLQWMMDTGEYSQIFFAGYTINTDIQFANGQITDTMFGSDFTNLFIEYRDAKDAELNAKDVYQTYLRRSYGSDFMKKMYSILVLGPSECFGGFKVDLSTTTCSYILDYVKSGGDLFFFHDTMTPYADAGAVNLTKSLLDVVGMNRFHVDFTDQSNTYNVKNIGLNSYSVTEAKEVGLYYEELTENKTVYEPLNVNAITGKDTLEYAFIKDGVKLTEDGTFYNKLNENVVDKDTLKYAYIKDNTQLTEDGTIYKPLDASLVDKENMTYTYDKNVQLTVNVEKLTYYASQWYQDSSGYYYKEEKDAGTNGLILDTSTGYLIDGTLKEKGYIYTRTYSYDSNTMTTTINTTVKTTVDVVYACNESGTYGYYYPVEEKAGQWGSVYLTGTAIYACDESGTYSYYYPITGMAGESGSVYLTGTAIYAYNFRTQGHGYYYPTNGTKGEWKYVYYDTYIPAQVSSSASGSSITDITYKSPDTTLYYFTPLRFSDDLGLVNSINYGLKTDNVGNQVSGTIFASALSMTYLYQDGNQGGGTTTLPFIYAQMGFMKDTAWSGSATQDQSASSQTVKASQLNEGLVTLYPFQISDTLNISGTHQQAYALDLESDKVKVWYTLAGANNSDDPKHRSSLYAADPYDAMENYFIYTTFYGSGAITYCGAGHSSVTGPTTKNNDERKLFINVIVNSAAAVVEKPSIKLYEPDGTFNKELAKDEEMTSATGRTVYFIEADSKTDTPEFDVKVTIPEGTAVTSVRMYYDGDYTGEGRPGYISDESHAEIYYEAFADGYTDVNWTKLMREASDLAALNLKEEYFSWYGGAYTYLVVEVYYEGSTKPVYSMIKIKAADPLFDLTEGTGSIAIASVDAVAEKEYVLG